jgi:hypothetical protein
MIISYGIITADEQQVLNLVAYIGVNKSLLQPPNKVAMWR